MIIRVRKTAEISYVEYWVIRVVKAEKERKTVVREIEYQIEPTERDIVEVLLTCEADEFITVAHNYKLNRKETKNEHI